jgi:hypothetical protein
MKFKMTKEDIEKKIHLYKDSISQLVVIENRVVEILDLYYSKHKDLITAQDFRPGTFGRLLSSILTSKFFMHSTLQYVSQSGWDADFKSNILPVKFNDPNFLGHFFDIDTGIRFYLFHSLHHQIETTFRILHKALKIDEGKPIEAVTKKLDLYNEELIKLYDATRNTIHNNGYYMPIGKKQEKEFAVDLNGKVFTFKENNPIAFTTGDFIEIALSEIEFIHKVLQNEVVVSLTIIKDISE